MAKASWATKLPKDMSDEELRLAKQAVYEDLMPTQEKLNTLAAMAAHLDSEITTRFNLSNVPVLNLQEYPLDAAGDMYGSSKSTSSE
jgi:hypothetical protein